jgi:hypothetical protein
MQTKIIKVIKPFWQFLEVYDPHQVHNMLSIMLDPRFKSLRVVKNYVGCEDYIHLGSKYDANAIILLLIMVFEILNPTISKCITIVAGFGYFIEKDNNIFGVGTFIEEFSHALLVGKLSLVIRLFITFVVCANPLVWSQIHESQFPNVGFLAKQIF